MHSSEEIRRKLDHIYHLEKKLLRIPMENARILNFKKEQHSMWLACGETKVWIPLLPVVVQYLSRAAWGGNDWDENKKQWAAAPEHELIQRIEQGLRQTDLHIMMQQQPNGKHEFYGMSPANFIPEDQNLFRDALFGSLIASGLFQPDFSLNGLTPRGEVWETFVYKGAETDRMAKSMVVIYGLNNGLSSYRFFFKRSIISCSNQLNFKDADLRRKHNDSLPTELFIEDVLGKSLRFGTLEEQQIAEAIERPLHRDILTEFFSRLHAPESVKEKLRHQLRQEVKAEGVNEFALSQTMTFMGSHTFGQGRDPHHARLMQRGGSVILDSTLAGVLESPVQTVDTEYGPAYGWLLPHRKAAV